MPRLATDHGQFEFGKDVIAQRGEPLTQYGFQTKAGDINLPQWSSQVRGQVEVMRTNHLAHPDYAIEFPREGILVLTGRLVGGAPLEVQNYKQHVEEGFADHYRDPQHYLGDTQGDNVSVAQAAASFAHTGASKSSAVPLGTDLEQVRGRSSS